jgi:molybdopterin converting factor small subunit
MNITIRLFATFRNERFKVEQREYAEGIRCGQVVSDVGLCQKDLGMALVNGRHASIEHVLSDGDTLSLFPLVGGG